MCTLFCILYIGIGPTWIRATLYSILCPTPRCWQNVYNKWLTITVTELIKHNAYATFGVACAFFAYCLCACVCAREKGVKREKERERKRECEREKMRERERERERERVRERESMSLSVSIICVCVCVCLCLCLLSVSACAYPTWLKVARMSYKFTVLNPKP